MTRTTDPQYDCYECYTFYKRTGGIYVDCRKLRQYEEIGLNPKGLCARIELFEKNKTKPKPQQSKEHYLRYFQYGEGR